MTAAIGSSNLSTPVTTSTKSDKESLPEMLAEISSLFKKHLGIELLDPKTKKVTQALVDLPKPSDDNLQKLISYLRKYNPTVRISQGIFKSEFQAGHTILSSFYAKILANEVPILWFPVASVQSDNKALANNLLEIFHKGVRQPLRKEAREFVLLQITSLPESIVTLITAYSIEKLGHWTYTKNLLDAFKSPYLTKANSQQN